MKRITQDSFRLYKSFKIGSSLPTTRNTTISFASYKRIREDITKNSDSNNHESLNNLKKLNLKKIEKEEEIENNSDDIEEETTNIETENDNEYESKEKATDAYLAKMIIGTVLLPKELVKRIQIVLKSISKSELKSAATTLSNALRAKTTDQHIPNKELLQSRLVGYNKQQALAYVAHRFPGVFGCNSRVFNEISKKLPDFNPQNMMDFGSGPGTAIWAAKNTWKNGIKSALAIEPSTSMMDIAVQLLNNHVNTQWRRFLFKPKDTSQIENQHELVTSSYVLTELTTQEERDETVLNLWVNVKPGGILVIIEPGTPQAFQVIKLARQLILDEHKINSNKVEEKEETNESESGSTGSKTDDSLDYDIIDDNVNENLKKKSGSSPSESKSIFDKFQKISSSRDIHAPSVVVPCPHSFVCPMKTPDTDQDAPTSTSTSTSSSKSPSLPAMSNSSSWCHFSQRVERLSIQMIAKPNSSISYEDEKFSFVAIRKGEKKDENQSTSIDDRLFGFDKIIRPPIKKDGHVILDTCSTNGQLKRNIISKSQGKDLYKAARKSNWGDNINNAYYKNQKSLNK